MQDAEKRELIQELSGKITDAALEIETPYCNEPIIYDQAEALADQARDAVESILEDISENGQVLAHSALVDAAKSGAMEKLEAMQKKLLDQKQPVKRGELAAEIKAALEGLKPLKQLKQRAETFKVIDQNELKKRLNEASQFMDECRGAVEGLKSEVPGEPLKLIANRLRHYSNPGSLAHELGFELQSRS